MNLTIEQEYIIREAIDKYGIEAQLDMVAEECSELIQAIMKYKRTKSMSGAENVLEESADVFIMLKQLESMFNKNNGIQEKIDFKLYRLKTRLKGGK